MTTFLLPQHSRTSDAIPLHTDPETARICRLLETADRLPLRAWDALTPDGRQEAFRVRRLLSESLTQRGGFTGGEVLLAAQFEARCLDVARAAHREALAIEAARLHLAAQIRASRANLAAAVQAAQAAAERARWQR